MRETSAFLRSLSVVFLQKKSYTRHHNRPWKEIVSESTCPPARTTRLPVSSLTQELQPQRRAARVSASHTNLTGHTHRHPKPSSGTGGGVETRLEAVKRINDWVFTEVAKEPSVGVPNGLEVLYSKRGDCNEHTALFVSLARAAEIPTRIAAGVVFSERVGPRGQFYYHAWPEVQLGGPADWVPVDPTFGQLPADATHIKLVEGDLDRQVEILGMIGKLD